MIINNPKIATPGQTLVEVLVTLLFIAVSVIALIRFQGYLSYDNSLSQQTGEATLLAHKQIETLRDFNVLDNLSGYTSYASIASSTSTVVGTTATYTVTSTVTTYTNPSYKKLDVTVSWTDKNSTSQSVQLISNIARSAPADSAAVI